MVKVFRSEEQQKEIRMPAFLKRGDLVSFDPCETISMTYPDSRSFPYRGTDKSRMIGFVVEVLNNENLAAISRIVVYSTNNNKLYQIDSYKVEKLNE